jgi:ParB-like chromosome segregation protein Spo0J
MAQVHFLDPAQVRTSYAALRPGAQPPHFPELADLPLRVTPTTDGAYEILDGFKRLARWREAGARTVPVVIEQPGTPAEHKRRLLVANAPPRTLTPRDEAEVVRSLVTDEGLTPAATARLLGRKPGWVEQRLLFATRLSSTAKDELGRGALRPTVAHALCALGHADQDAVLQAMARHDLRTREALTLVHAYRVADERDRTDLLRDPHAVAARRRARAAPGGLSPPAGRAARLHAADRSGARRAPSARGPLSRRARRPDRDRAGARARRSTPDRGGSA